MAQSYGKSRKKALNTINSICDSIAGGAKPWGPMNLFTDVDKNDLPTHSQCVSIVAECQKRIQEYRTNGGEAAKANIKKYGFSFEVQSRITPHNQNGATIQFNYWPLEVQA